MITKTARGVSPLKVKRLARGETRPEEMPPCATCLKLIMGAAVSGYDNKWRCLPCNAVHYREVFRESGESAPLPSDDTSSTHTSAAFGRAHEAKRQAKAKAVLDKYGLARRSR